MPCTVPLSNFHIAMRNEADTSAAESQDFEKVSVVERQVAWSGLVVVALI